MVYGVLNEKREEQTGVYSIKKTVPYKEQIRS